jgi:dTDP-4-amino-4,6-dideoxygalactose transaminase
VLTAISRYGARVIPNTEQIVAALESRGRLIEGPEIAAFEQAFARRLGLTRATSASYGRMAFYYLLEALNLPKGSEIVFPALTFWVVPELARVAGLTPVFADIDPHTYTLDPQAFERAITPRTSAVVPTHLYGLTCDMDAIMRIARRHNLTVIEDCAHALGARLRGQPAGTFGHGAFFSFQTLKPLNTYGGGIAVARDPAVQTRVAELAASEPWPSRDRVRKRLRLGRAQRVLIRPPVFTWTLFPVLWGASFVTKNPDVYLWEKIRPLWPLPDPYTERYSNVQAAIGLEALQHLDTWTAATQAHARLLDSTLAGVPGVQVPLVPVGYEHVYYQYCVEVPDRAQVIRQAIRRGVDVESLHVDVCPSLELFGPSDTAERFPGAARAAESVQLPVYEALSDQQVSRVARTLERAVGRTLRPKLAPSRA